MPDAKVQTADVVIREVMTPVIENFARKEAALLQLGLATDITSEVNYAEGGRHVTRPEFRGNVQVNRLRGTNETQKVTYESVRYPLVSSIVSVQYEGEQAEDAFDDKGFVNRVVNHVKEKVVQDLDETLISYTADIGDGSLNYGASGSGSVLDVSGEGAGTLNYDAFARALGKFGDAKGAAVALLHSKPFTDLLLTTEAKNVQQGVVIGSQAALFFPTLGAYAVKSDRIPVADGVYTNLICRPAAMSYAWKNPFSMIPKYEGNFIWTIDFVWRYAIARNQTNAVDRTVRLLSKTAQPA